MYRTDGSYLLLDVIKGVGRVDGEADQDDVRIGVGEGTETVVILLAGGIPEGQLDMLAVDLDIGDVVFKDGGNVDLVVLESVRCHRAGITAWAAMRVSRRCPGRPS